MNSLGSLIGGFLILAGSLAQAGVGDVRDTMVKQLDAERCQKILVDTEHDSGGSLKVRVVTCHHPRFEPIRSSMPELWTVVNQRTTVLQAVRQALLERAHGVIDDRGLAIAVHGALASSPEASGLSAPRSKTAEQDKLESRYRNLMYEYFTQLRCRNVTSQVQTGKDETVISRCERAHEKIVNIEIDGLFEWYKRSGIALRNIRAAFDMLRNKKISNAEFKASLIAAVDFAGLGKGVTDRPEIYRALTE